MRCAFAVSLDNAAAHRLLRFVHEEQSARETLLFTNTGITRLLCRVVCNSAYRKPTRGAACEALSWLVATHISPLRSNLLAIVVTELRVLSKLPDVIRRKDQNGTGADCPAQAGLRCSSV